MLRAPNGHGSAEAAPQPTYNPASSTGGAVRCKQCWATPRRPALPHARRPRRQTVRPFTARRHLISVFRESSSCRPVCRTLHVRGWLLFDCNGIVGMLAVHVKRAFLVTRQGSSLRTIHTAVMLGGVRPSCATWPPAAQRRRGGHAGCKRLFRLQLGDRLCRVCLDDQRATSRTILPAVCPLSIMAVACRISASGRTAAMRGLTCPVSTSAASSGRTLPTGGDVKTMACRTP
jgi:hypothetical protein